jgi:hypothetical protein
MMMPKAVTRARPNHPVPWLTDMSTLSACNFMLGLIMAFPETFFAYSLVAYFEPSVVQLLTCAMYSPWMAKPLYALVLDRSPHDSGLFVQVMLPLSASLWAIMLLVDNFRVTLALFVLDAILFAFADVALDRIMVRRAKLGGELEQRGLQSHMLVARSVGMMAGAYAGGVVMGEFGAVGVYCTMIGFILTFFALSHMLADVRAYKHTQKGARVHFMSLITPQAKKAILFTFMVKAVPDIGGLFDYFLISELKFTPVVIGSLDMLGCMAATAGAYAYSQIHRGHKTATVIRLSLLSLAAECVFMVALVRRWSTLAGISDVTMASFNTVVRGISLRMLAMPLNGAIMPFCAEGHEGTMYALFTSVANIAAIGGIMLGSGLSVLFGMSRDNLSSLWILCVIQGLCYLVLIPFATLICEPDMHTNDTADLADAEAGARLRDNDNDTNDNDNDNDNAAGARVGLLPLGGPPSPSPVRPPPPYANIHSTK